MPSRDRPSGAAPGGQGEIVAAIGAIFCDVHHVHCVRPGTGGIRTLAVHGLRRADDERAIGQSLTLHERKRMRVWIRSAALAGGALLLAGMHVGAQIRELAGSGSKVAPRSGPMERPNHPVVLLNGRVGESVAGERVIVEFRLQQMDPKEVVEKVTPPKGVDGIIAYPASRMLTLRGTKEAVSDYRTSLEKLDRANGVTASAGARPAITLAAAAKLSVKADKVEGTDRDLRATGDVVIGLPNGIELRAQQVRITTEGGRKRVVIEK